MINLKQILFSNSLIKVNSLIISFLFWLIISESYIISIWVNTPLCFYNIDSNIKVDAPSNFDIELKGKKTIIRELDKENIFLFIDAKELRLGNNPYILTDKNIFLPSSITIRDYKPRCLNIKLQNTK